MLLASNVCGPSCNSAAGKTSASLATCKKSPHTTLVPHCENSSGRSARHRLASQSMPDVELAVGDDRLPRARCQRAYDRFRSRVDYGASVWDPVIDDLARDHRCIAPTLSLRGSCGSRYFAGSRFYSVGWRSTRSQAPSSGDGPSPRSETQASGPTSSPTSRIGMRNPTCGQRRNAWSRLKNPLVVWSAEDRVMPRDHGAKLAALLPDARLVMVDDSYVLVQRDRPGELGRVLREFVAERSLNR